MKRINYKSDFDFILRLADCQGNPVGWPDYDWTARIWTGLKANAYIASCIGGQTLNCYNDGGLIHIVVDSHRLSPGILQIEFTADIPNADYPDQAERIVIPLMLEIELIREAAPCPESFEVQLMLPYIKFRYEDLTPEQKAELMQPAVDAANHAEAVLKDAEAATAQAVESNRKLAADIEVAAEAERLRQRSEETRISNEESRQRAETLRENAETQREAAETTREESESARVTSEAARVSAESERAKAETARVTAEKARESAESKRVEQENSRKEAEESRVSEETKRVDAEAKRVTEENKRKTAEQDRKTAESGRVLAEQKRATEFESWQSEIDAKPDRSELSNVLAVPTENRVEEIEPGIITEALRKVPQVLTPEEQEQVKANIGVSKMELFCDLFTEACIVRKMYGLAIKEQYGYARIIDGVFDCMLNGLSLTYEEAVRIYNAGPIQSSHTVVSLQFNNNSEVRTNLPLKYMGGVVEANYAFVSGTNIEVINARGISLYINTIFGCGKLRRIVSPVQMARNIDNFKRCPMLEDVELVFTNTSPMAVSFADCPLLSLASLQYMVSNTRNKAAVTITVHPDVYAKLTDETNEEWHKVLTDAADKNINFATI